MVRWLLGLLVVTLLAGCTAFDDGAGEEAQEPTLRLVAVNAEGDAPFFVRFQVVAPNGTAIEVDEMTVDPGESEAALVPAPDAGEYRVEMLYDWSQGGRGASGSDAQVVEVSACEGVTEATWRFTEEGGAVWSRFLGAECVA